ncbi:MAG: hypothetical protein KAH38_10080 [Candidatus Hydrogenedentes bacterium]|nr:hypothetical protein [Candidatus Hydrogenedentota bacterium]
MPYNLDIREKMALALGLLATVLALVLAIYVPLVPRKGYIKSQGNLSALKQDYELQIMYKMDEGDRLQQQKALMEVLGKRSPDFSLFTYVDTILTSTNLRARAQLEQYRPRNVSPKQPMVQLHLQGISSQELVDFLHKIYGDNNLIAVYKLDYLRAAANDQGMDCDITFVTLTL